LPQPLGPTRVTNSFSPTVRDVSASAPTGRRDVGRQSLRHRPRLRALRALPVRRVLRPSEDAVLVHGGDAAVLHHYLAAHQHSVHAGPRLRVHESRDGIRERPQEDRASAQQDQIGLGARRDGPQVFSLTQHARGAGGGEPPHRLRVEPALGGVGEADRADHGGDAQGLEEVLVVRAHRAVGAEPHRDPPIEHLPHGSDARAQAEIASRIVGDGGARVGEHAQVIVGEPDRVRAHESRAEDAVIGEAGHDALAPAALALHRLHLGFREMRVDADTVLARKPRATVEELVGGLVGNGRRHRHADAPVGAAMPPADGPLREVEQALGRRGLHRLDRPPQVGGKEIEEAGHGLEEDHVGHGGGEDDANADVPVGAHHRFEPLVGDGGHGHVEVIGRGAARLEHLDGADRRREIFILRRAKGVVGRGVGEEIFEGPASRSPAGEMARGMSVRVAEAGQYQVLAGVDLPSIHGSGEVYAHRGDALAVDQDVRARHGGRGAREHATAANDEAHGALRPYFFSGSRSLV